MENQVQIATVASNAIQKTAIVLTNIFNVKAEDVSLCHIFVMVKYIAQMGEMKTFAVTLSSMKSSLNLEALISSRFVSIHIWNISIIPQYFRFVAMSAVPDTSNALRLTAFLYPSFVMGSNSVHWGMMKNTVTIQLSDVVVC